MPGLCNARDQNPEIVKMMTVVIKIPWRGGTSYLGNEHLFDFTLYMWQALLEPLCPALSSAVNEDLYCHAILMGSVLMGSYVGTLLH